MSIRTPQRSSRSSPMMHGSWMSASQNSCTTSWSPTWTTSRFLPIMPASCPSLTTVAVHPPPPPPRECAGGAPGRWSTPCPPRPGRVWACSGGRGPWRGQGRQPERTDHGEGETFGVVVPSLVHSAAVFPAGRGGLARGAGAGQSWARWPGSPHRKQRRPPPDARRSGGWRPLPGALGRRPSLETLLPVLILLAVVRPPDVRLGGTGAAAGWVGRRAPRSALSASSSAAPKVGGLVRRTCCPSRCGASPRRKACKARSSLTAAG